MTKAEYADYVQRVDDFFKREGIDNLSPESHGEDGDWNETEFSSHPCECCHRYWAGARVTCNGYNPTTKGVQGGYEVCEDCVYFTAYGRLDDETMLSVEKDTES